MGNQDKQKVQDALTALSYIEINLNETLENLKRIATGCQDLRKELEDIINPPVEEEINF